MYSVYVIQSEFDISFYIGKTSDLTKRLLYHNSPQMNVGITKRKIPWHYYYVLEVENSALAGKIENHIKRMKSRSYIMNLKKYPEIGEKTYRKVFINSLS